MFLIREPSGARVSRAFDAQRGASFSYAEVGASREAPGGIPGYTVDHNRARLGEGEETFERAVEALRGWRMFDVGWAGLLPAGAPVEVGTTVAVFARHYGFWSLNSTGSPRTPAAYAGAGSPTERCPSTVRAARNASPSSGIVTVRSSTTSTPSPGPTIHSRGWAARLRGGCSAASRGTR